MVHCKKRFKMPGGRRNTSRAPPPKPVALIEQENKRSNNFEDGPPVTPISPPKHMPIPEIPHTSELAFETLMFGFSLLALALQYLNIYRTVFWLPHSHTKYAMNLYLIDPSVVGFIVVTLARRLTWSIVKLAVTRCLHHSLWKSSLAIARRPS